MFEKLIFVIHLPYHMPVLIIHHHLKIQHHQFQSLGQYLPSVVLKAVGGVALEEEVGVEVGRGLCRGTQAQTVHLVLRDGGVDRADVHLRGLFGVGARLDKVFDEGLGREEHQFEALELLQALDEQVHAVLAGGERVGAVLGPEGFVAHSRVGVLHLVPLEAESLVGDFGEGEAAVFGGALHLKFL